MSIPSLIDSACQLGDYYFDSEWEVIQTEFFNSSDEVTTLEQFKEWVKNYMYFNIVTCFNGGDEGAIEAQLEDDWSELKVAEACEPVLPEWPSAS